MKPYEKLSKSGKWQRDNPEYSKQYCRGNRERLKQYRRGNAEYWKQWSRDSLAFYKTLAFAILGKKCAHCGTAYVRVLQMHHNNGGGREERRGSYTYIYYRNIADKLLNGSKDYSLLCANCNWLDRLGNARRENNRVRLKAIEKLGGKCSRCGVRDIRVLQIDHVNGGGCKHIQTFKNTLQYYREILKEIEAGSKDYQVLCANCNFKKERI